ncbi:MAG: helix-turn-helix domain-containing protein [Deltaproteobacteria bacterium]
MKIQDQLTDKAILEELGNRISSCRIRVGLTQGEASSKSGIAKRTLERVEAGLPAQSDSLVKIFRALGILDRLDALIPEDTGPSPMELLKLKGKEKQRASKPHKINNEATAKDWSWGDNK